MRRFSFLLGLLLAGSALLFPSIAAAQLPQPRTSDYGLQGGGSLPGLGGLGALGGGQGGAQDYGAWSNPGFGYTGQGPNLGLGGGAQDPLGNMLDRSYGGSPLSSGQSLGLNNFNLGTSATRGSVGTGVYGGGRTNAYFASQGFYNFSNRYSGQGTQSQSFGGSSLVPFTRRSTSPYLNLIDSRGAAAVRYYGQVKPQFASENQFKAIADRVNQNQEALKIDSSLQAMQKQMEQIIKNERAIQEASRLNDFSANPGGDRFALSLGGRLNAPQPDNQDQYYNQRLADLQAQIQGNAMGNFGDVPVPRIRVPTIQGGGAPPPNFGNTTHYYGSNQNVPNWRFTR